MIFYLLIVALAVLADQLTKWIAADSLALTGSVPLIPGILNFTYVENTGAAFGMLKDHRWLFMAVSTVAILLMLAYLTLFSRRLSPLLGSSLALIIGGGIGNMIDRVIYGYVVDFIDVTVINFWVFNFADMCVCVGAILLLLSVILAEVDETQAARRREKARAQKEARARRKAAPAEETYTPMFVVIDDPEQKAEPSDPPHDGDHADA